MADRRDDVDSWLSERINPLPPPPGTFDLIKRRARRRKYRKLAITASSAAVLVAAAVTVPQVVNLNVLSPNPTSGVAAGHPSTATPSGAAGTQATSAVSQVPTPTPATGPVPANFKPSSVTFVGLRTGWVIGQAGTPGHCATSYCTSVARTSTAGKTWAGLPAPVTGSPDGATGVSQVRFLNLNDGWAYGPELFATHDGGHHWAPVSTNGMRVTDLETVGDRVFAIFASCRGSDAEFAAQCTSFTLYSAPAAGGVWAPVGAATTGLTSGATSEAASLVLTGSRGFLLAPDGKLYAGPVTGEAWSQVGSVVSSCAVGPPQPGGQPAGALLAAASAQDLILACTTATGTGSGSGQAKAVYSSPNGGTSWIRMAAAPPGGIAYSLTASPSVSVVLGTSQGIDLLPAGDTTWQAATLAGQAPTGGFGYVGMTTDEQGIALPADPAAGAVWFTVDGGQTWTPSSVSGS